MAGFDRNATGSVRLHIKRTESYGYSAFSIAEVSPCSPCKRQNLASSTAQNHARDVRHERTGLVRRSLCHSETQRCSQPRLDSRSAIDQAAWVSRFARRRVADTPSDLILTRLRHTDALPLARSPTGRPVNDDRHLSEQSHEGQPPQQPTARATAQPHVTSRGTIHAGDSAPHPKLPEPPPVLEDRAIPPAR